MCKTMELEGSYCLTYYAHFIVNYYIKELCISLPILISKVLVLCYAKKEAFSLPLQGKENKRNNHSRRGIMKSIKFSHLLIIFNLFY
jgi:hypothetical protein